MSMLTTGLIRKLPTLLVLIYLTTSSHVIAQTFPTLSGRVVDQANLLEPETEVRLTESLEALELETGDQLVVVTLDSLQDYEIEDFGYRLGRAWGIGQSASDSGVLLIIAPNERRVRIEVGYGLEPIITDAFASEVIQTQILPPFQVGGYQRGIVAGADAITEQLRLDPVEAQARAAEAAQEPPRSDWPIGPGVVVLLMFGFLLIGLVRASSAGGRRRKGRVSPVLIWAASDILRHAARSGTRNGGGTMFGTGGGFRGGGGSFGGGGASGGW